MSEINWHERILELALEEKRVTEANATLNDEIERLHLEHIAALEDVIDGNNAQLETLRNQLKSDFQSYVESTGELDAHPALKYVRKKKLMYDKKEIIAEAQVNGVDSVLRVKTELDVRAFEKAIKDGKAKWATILVEETASPYVTISKLGEYVIAYEAGLESEKNDG